MTYEAFQRTYAPGLSSQQAAAVRAVEGPVLLLAVPGSGKTTVLVTRLGYMLLCCGIQPESILTMTYTVSAARDMKERFAALFGRERAEKMEFRTINGVSARIIHAYERLLGRKAFELISDEGEIAALIREIYRSAAKDFPTDSDIKAIQTAITYAKNEMLDQEGIEELGKKLEHFPAIYRAYNQALREQARMDYDDQMVYALQILRRYPDLLARFQRQYRYLCVDEAQDTSRIQHAIIDLLAQGHGNLFMVGDEDQSIYGFRAACPEALLNFERTHPGARVLLMEENYRSTPQIVTAADRFIRQNTTRRPKHMTTSRPEGKPVGEIPLRDRRSQYAYLVKVARDCRAETAVLYRDNDCALPLIDLLERQGIPYRCRQMDFGFFSHRVTRDVVDILTLSRRPWDKDAFLRVYYKFGAGITRQAAEYAAAHCPEGMSLFSFLTELDGLSDWARMKAKALQTHLTNMRQERADKAVYRIRHFMGYGDYLDERGADPQRLSILEALGEQEPTPERLLERLEELRKILQNPKGTDCPFILSTIHSSKGLEYERVYLMDVLDGVFPKEGEDVDEDEERRLFYVGMTRAKEELCVFTFQKTEQGSAFSKYLFPKESARPHPVRPQSRAHSARRPAAPKELPSTEKFLPGREVLHRQFGPGKISTRNEDIITLELENGTTKKLSLSTALRSNSLKLR